MSYICLPKDIYGEVLRLPADEVRWVIDSLFASVAGEDIEMRGWEAGRLLTLLLSVQEAGTSDEIIL